MFSSCHRFAISRDTSLSLMTKMVWCLSSKKKVACCAVTMLCFNYNGKYTSHKLIFTMRQSWRPRFIAILSCLSAVFLNHSLSFEATFKSRSELIHTGVQFKKKCVCIIKYGFHRSRVPMQKHVKHSFVSLVIPGHDPPLDITVYVDISNPGLVQSIITTGGWQRITQDLIQRFGSTVCRMAALQYSGRELMSLRKY